MKAGKRSLSRRPGSHHLRVDRHLSVVQREPQHSRYDLSVSARGLVLPVDLGEASERALPSRTLPLALEPAFFGAEVLHCPIGTAHQDLRAEEHRMARRARRPRPRLPALSAVAHLCLAACTPTQGAHRLFAPRLSWRREVRRLFALKVHSCGTRTTIASESRNGDARSSRRPTPLPTFQNASVGANPCMIPACSRSRHSGAREPKVHTSGAALASPACAYSDTEELLLKNRKSKNSPRQLVLLFTKMKYRELFVEIWTVTWPFYIWSKRHTIWTTISDPGSPSLFLCSKAMYISV